MTCKNDKNAKSSTSFASALLITLSCTLLFMLNNGVRSNFGLISSALTAYTGLSESAVSLAVAAAQLLYGLSQPFFGMLALKKTNSFVLGTGGILMGMGLLLIPLGKSNRLLFISLGVLVGLAAGALAFGIVMGAASPAIGKKYAAAASGIINGGGGLGGAVLAPYLQSMTDNNMFSEGMVILACLSGCTVLLCIWLNKKEKKSMSEDINIQNAPTVREILSEAFKSCRFLHLALAFFTCGFFMAIIEAYLYPQLISYGFSGSKVAFLFTVYGIMGMIGPVISGFLCGKTDPKWVLGTVYALRPVLVILFLLLPKNEPAVFAFVIGLGLAGNATVPPTTLLIDKFFGSRKMPALSGIAMVFHQIGSAVSTALGGILTGFNSGYSTIWLCGAATAVIAAALCYTLITENAKPA